MNIDEKIALLEKEQRRVQQEELNQESIKLNISYTIENFQRGLKRGIAFVEYKKLSIKMREFFNGQIKMPFIEEFFETVEENEQAVCLESKQHGVSCMLVKVFEKEDRIPVEEWEIEFFGNMRKCNMYCHGVKREKLEYLDYLCYEISTMKGKLFNITFRLIEDESYFIGIFNCQNKECESMGVLLETIVCEVNNYKSNPNKEES